MKIILASQSPRRVFLMQQMGLDFEQIPSDFEEYFDDSRPATEVAKELGLGKAEYVARDHPNDIIIGSDLIVVIDGKQIGKPENVEDAKTRLREISGRTHELICSVAVVCKSKNYAKVKCQSAFVSVDKLTEKFISEYAETKTTLDKAGGYAIEHPLMKPHIKEIKGRKDLIIGLPTNLVSELLKDFNIDVEPLYLDNEITSDEGFYK